MDNSADVDSTTQRQFLNVNRDTFSLKDNEEA